MDETITKTLDLKGFSRPLPIAKTAQAIRDLQPGELIESLATGPGRGSHQRLVHLDGPRAGRAGRGGRGLPLGDQGRRG